MSPRKRPDSEPAHVAEGAAPAPPLGPDGKPLRFEQALERLEKIVDQLENGKLSLEDSIARFEEGVTLSKHLEGELKRAEKRVEELVERAGAPGTRPWAGDDEAGESDDFEDDDDGAL